MTDAVIVSACRTPITDAYRGSLANVGVRDLAKLVVVEAIERSGVPATEVDDVVLGEVLQGGGCIARYVAIEAGLPPDTPGLALNRQCATGLTAVGTAAANIMAGMDRVVIAGGAESMTQSPLSYRKAAYPWGIPEQFISPSHPDTPDAPNMNMMITVGENTATKVGVTREQSDDWSFGSHQKAIAAIDEGRFKEEIVPVGVTGWDGQPTSVEVDEHPRRDTSLEKLASAPGAVGRPERHRHRRQLVADQRRRRGHDDRLGRLRRGERSRAARVRPVVGRGGRRAGRHRHRAHHRHPPSARPRRHHARRRRRSSRSTRRSRR